VVLIEMLDSLAHLLGLILSLALFLEMAQTIMTQYWQALARFNNSRL